MQIEFTMDLHRNKLCLLYINLEVKRRGTSRPKSDVKKRPLNEKSSFGLFHFKAARQG